MNNFDIVIPCRNDYNWLQNLLLSLKKTLCNQKKNIYILDDSKNKQDINKLGLKIHITRSNKLDEIDKLYKNWRQRWLKAVDLSKNTNICFIHSDVVFLMEGWDQYIEKQLKNFTLIASFRHKKYNQKEYLYPKSHFMVARKKVLLTSKFETINFFFSNHKPKLDEHGAISYFDISYNGRILELPIKDFRSSFGSVAYTLEKKELLYHNRFGFYIPEKPIIPMSWFRYRKSKQNALLLSKYIKEEWPKPLINFIHKNTKILIITMEEESCILTNLLKEHVCSDIYNVTPFNLMQLNINKLDDFDIIIQINEEGFNKSSNFYMDLQKILSNIQHSRQIGSPIKDKSKSMVIQIEYKKLMNNPRVVLQKILNIL